MQRGYVKVWRKIQDSGLMQMPNTLAFFMHILFNATHKDIKVGTSSGVIELKRGQYIDGLNRLAKSLKQTPRQIRTSQQRLTDLEIIRIKTTNKYSIYTIENYGLYQDSDTLNDNQTTIKRQSNDNQTTTKQELNNLNINSNTLRPADACPYDELLNLYHACLPDNPKCKVLNHTRKSLIKQRWNEAAKLNCKPFGYSSIAEGLKAWEEFFHICAASEFLTGKVKPREGQKTFYATIDFIFSPSGFAKTLENNYHRD